MGEKQPTPWVCIHTECGKVAFYAKSVIAKAPPKKENGVVATSVQYPTAIPEGWTVEFDDTCSRVYPDGKMPEYKECKCWSCGKIIPMYPKDGTLQIRFDEPDWEEFFEKCIKDVKWILKSALQDAERKPRAFKACSDETKKTFQKLKRWYKALC